MAMKTIKATAVGMNWLSDLFAALPHGPVKVLSPSGKACTITRHKTQARFKFNGSPIAFQKLWQRLTTDYTN